VVRKKGLTAKDAKEAQKTQRMTENEFQNFVNFVDFLCGLCGKKSFLVSWWWEIAGLKFNLTY